MPAAPIDDLKPGAIERQVGAAHDAVYLARAIFVANRLNCTLAIDERVERALISGAAPLYQQRPYGRTATPSSIENLADLALMVPGIVAAAILLGAPLVVLRWCRARSKPID